MVDFINNSSERILCLNITKSYNEKKQQEVYDCVRKFWKLDGKRAQKANLVFAVCNGIIVGVFKPSYWFLTDNESLKGRWEFEGEEILDSPYLNQSLFKLFHGRRNPVMYINM